MEELFHLDALIDEVVDRVGDGVASEPEFGCPFA
jgi:hypothetical protein